MSTFFEFWLELVVPGFKPSIMSAATILELPVSLTERSAAVAEIALSLVYPFPALGTGNLPSSRSPTCTSASSTTAIAINFIFLLFESSIALAFRSSFVPSFEMPRASLIDDHALRVFSLSPCRLPQLTSSSPACSLKEIPCCSLSHSMTSPNSFVRRIILKGF